MSDDNTRAPESDDELRASLRGFDREVADRTDTDAALAHLPQCWRPPTTQLMAIAACVLAVVVLAAALTMHRGPVETTDPSESPTQPSDCQSTQTRVNPGGQMSSRLVRPVASAAIALVLVGGCGDDGSTTLAEGEDVELVGDNDLGGQTLDISAEEEDGEVTGELRFSDPGGRVVVEVECADTDADGVVVLGGSVTEADDMSGLVALFIREGDPDSVALWIDEGENKSCRDLLVNRRDVLDDDSAFVDVEAGSDIETG